MNRTIAVLPVVLTELLFASHAVASDPDFNMYRWKEDYAYLADKDARDWYDQFKYTPLGTESHVSFGGSVRQRLNMYENDRFGLQGVDDGHVLLNRIYLHSDWYIANQLRAFVELGAYQADGNELRPGPFDKSSGDITQAFVDLKFDAAQLRLGRQEMKLGSTRLVGVRNGPNVRRSFDGLRLDTNINDVDLRLFALNEVEVEEDGFDNDANDDEALWGAYTTWNFDVTQADIYYLGLYRGGAGYTQGTANETRHSVGTRVFGEKNAWDWNYEFIYQFGEFGAADISAWTAASITGYSFKNTAWKPRLALSANIASGDDDPNDDDLGTFNPLYPNLAYFEEASILAPQNFINVEPEVTLHPSDKLSISTDWNFFWRLNDNDAVYVRGLNALPGTAGVTGSFVAHVPSISVDYQLNRHITLDISYSHFFAQEVIHNAGGEDIDYIKTEVNWTF